nr:hypothetical protein [Tanacetum cinerariifolium]
RAADPPVFIAGQRGAGDQSKAVPTARVVPIVNRA